MNAMNDLISRPKRYGKNTEAMLELVKTIDALQAENVRLRNIVQTLSGWHENLQCKYQEYNNPALSISDMYREDDIENLCEKAWKELNPPSTR